MGRKTPPTWGESGHDGSINATSPVGPRIPYWLPLLLAVAAVLVMPFDVVIGRWFATVGLPGELRRLLDVAESYGNGWGAALIVLGVAAVLVTRKVRAWRVLAMGLGGGMAVNLAKIVVSRTRPRAFDFDRAGDVGSTFGDWLPFLHERFESAWQSFPSAHSGTAAGLSVGLIWLAPRSGWYFTLLTALVMCERIASSAHWPSDTLFGAALGLLVAKWCLPGGWIGRAFDRLENRSRG